MERIVADVKVILGILAVAAYVYILAHNFVKPQPRGRENLNAIVIGLAGGAYGLIVALLVIYEWHVSAILVVALFVILSIVSALIGIKHNNASVNQRTPRNP